MFDIRVKAKLKSRNRWISGYYFKKEKVSLSPVYFNSKLEHQKEIEENIVHCICFNEITDWEMPQSQLCAEINPNTLCLFSGFCDSNKVCIFTNDVITITGQNKINYILVLFDNELKNVCLCFDKDKKEIKNMGAYLNSLKDKKYKIEIIGNIIDNPSLFEESLNNIIYY